MYNADTVVIKIKKTEKDYYLRTGIFLDEKAGPEERQKKESI